MKIYLGADHNGFELKRKLRDYLERSGYSVVDDDGKDRKPDDDFPIFAERVVRAMFASTDPDVRGILICGSGQGMCMAANRFKKIRASLVWSATEARAARNDDDSNVLCLPSRHIDAEEAMRLTGIWLTTPFAGAARFKRRIGQLDGLGS